jgi:CRISPR-associated protein Cmr2
VAHLKARHAIQLKDLGSYQVDDKVAIAIFNCYFDFSDQTGKTFAWEDVLEDDSSGAIVKWIDDLIQVGWQLCSST